MRKLISLGQRSDVAFQLRMHGEENVAHFFDWLSTPVDAIIQILNANFDVFYPDHLTLDTTATPHHVVDRVTNVQFFHQFPLYNGNVLPNFLIFYESFISKFRVLAERFRSYVTSGPVTLVRRGITEPEAVALESAFFRRFPGADAKFLYIVEHNQHFVSEHGTTRSIKDEGSLGDPIAWWAALQDEGLIGPAFRHATAEILQHQSDDHGLSVLDRFTEVQLQTAGAVHFDHGKFPLELARFYARRHRWDKAEEMARLTLARSPGLPNAVFELNYISWKGKKITPDEAANAFIVFLKNETYDPSWLTETCAALLEAGRIEEAVAYSDKAVMATPMDSEAHYHRAMCFIRQNKFDRANYAITTALGLREHPYMRHIHATILAELGRWDEAIAVAKAACKLDSGIFYINHLAALLLRTAEPTVKVAEPAPAPEPLGALEPEADVVQLRDIAATELVPLAEQPTTVRPAVESIAEPEPVPEPTETPPSTIHKFATAAHEAEHEDEAEAEEEEEAEEEQVVAALLETVTPLKRLLGADLQSAREDGATPIRVLSPLRA